MVRIPRQFYPDEFRYEAVSLVVDGGLTVADVSRRLSVSHQTLRNWIKKYRNDGLPDKHMVSTIADRPHIQSEMICRTDFESLSL